MLSLEWSAFKTYNNYCVMFTPRMDTTDRKNSIQNTQIKSN